MKQYLVELSSVVKIFQMLQSFLIFSEFLMWGSLHKLLRNCSEVFSPIFYNPFTPVVVFVICMLWFVKNVLLLIPITCHRSFIVVELYLTIQQNILCVLIKVYIMICLIISWGLSNLQIACEDFSLRWKPVVFWREVLIRTRLVGLGTARWASVPDSPSAQAGVVCAIQGDWGSSPVG